MTYQSQIGDIRFHFVCQMLPVIKQVYNVYSQNVLIIRPLKEFIFKLRV
jgi:hypothetical protein